MPVALLAVLAFVPQQQTPSSYAERNSSGVMAIAQSIPKATSVCAQLWISAQATPETPATHGWRHLLEHFLARGPKGDIDARLESRGMWLKAETFRDSMRFRINGPASEIGTMLQALRDVATLGEVGEQALAHEVGILEQELALQSEFRKMSGVAWGKAFGPLGLDAMGTLETVRQVTPAGLGELAARMLHPNHMSVTITGEIDPKSAVATACDVFSFKSPGPRLEFPERKESVAGRAFLAGVRGSVVGARVGPVWERSTLATIALALGMTNVDPEIRISYTPSAQPGLVLLYHPRSAALFAALRDQVVHREFVRICKSFMISWMQTLFGDAETLGEYLCVLQGGQESVDSMQRKASALTAGDLTEALERFMQPRSVEVTRP